MMAWKSVLVASGVVVFLTLALFLFSILKVAARADRQAEEYWERLVKQKDKKDAPG